MFLFLKKKSKEIPAWDEILIIPLVYELWLYFLFVFSLLLQGVWKWELSFLFRNQYHIFKYQPFFKIFLLHIRCWIIIIFVRNLLFFSRISLIHGIEKVITAHWQSDGRKILVPVYNKPCNIFKYFYCMYHLSHLIEKTILHTIFSKIAPSPK